MSFFSKLFGRGPHPASRADAPPPPPPATAQAPVEPPPQREELALLAALGEPGGPSAREAEHALRTILGTPRELPAIEAVASALLRGPVPERLRVLCAQALVARGEPRRALPFLAEVTDAAALMLRADLLHDAGELAQAVSVIERVLARDIDTPGARERHSRWRRRLAPRGAPPIATADVTVAVPILQQSPFRILREVARGGAGTVYEAADDALGRKVALKVYHRAEADRNQLLREARTAVQLAGAGIIRVFDVHPEQGWIALEWLERGSLRDLMARGEFAPLIPMGLWVMALARALGRVHGAGFVHADVKPANVLLSGPGDAILTDLGIAALVGTDSLGGSAGFLSPERLAGRPLQFTDDVYGFGRVLEDTLVRLPASPEHERMRALAAQCMAPLEQRPSDGWALVSLLRS